MQSKFDTSLRRATAGRVMGLSGALLLALLSGCEEPQPRTFEEFMEDQFARDGTLVRCNEYRNETLNDIECANARRAASVVALREEQERRQQLEVESARKIDELRARLARQDAAIRGVQAAAEAAAKAAYDAQWDADGDEGSLGIDGQPLDAAALTE